MGGFVAVHGAARHPKRIGRVVLIEGGLLLGVDAPAASTIDDVLKAGPRSRARTAATGRSSRAPPASPAGRETSRQPTRDVLGRPAQLELRLDYRPQATARRQLRRPGPPGTPPRSPVSATRPIGAPTAVGGDLPRHRRGCTTKPLSDVTQRVARRQPARDLLSLGQRQPQRRPLTLRRRRPQQRPHGPPNRKSGPVDLLMKLPHRHPLSEQLGDPPLLLHRQPLHAPSRRSPRPECMLRSRPESTPEPSASCPPDEEHRTRTAETYGHVSLLRFTRRGRQLARLAGVGEGLDA
jgi:pimeloyl-ACP methyl ester carboxylesterase